MNSRRRKRLKAKMLMQHPVCAYCGTTLTMETATIDHVTPKSKGGADRVSNRVLACRKCNSSKSNSTPDPEVAEIALSRFPWLPRLPR